MNQCADDEGLEGSASKAGPSEGDYLFEHLSLEFDGVYSKERVDRHIVDYVGTTIAEEQVRQVLFATPAGGRVLDVGCGYGTFVLVARRSGLDAIGIELADFELQFARRRLQIERPTDDPLSTYRKADALAVPFPKDSFDAVTLWNVVEHVPSYKRLLVEAVRVLRPGGRVYLVAPNYAAFRQEAHYHVPWLPLMPRRLGSAYLRLLGRNPRFFESSIFYCTNLSVRRTLARLGVRAEDPKQRKLVDPSLINNPRIREIVRNVHSARFLWLLLIVQRLRSLNPFKSAIEIESVKNAPAHDPDTHSER